MPVRIRATPYRPVVPREREPWRPDDAEVALAYRRLVAMLRLVHVLEDRLGLDRDTAARIATRLLRLTPDDDG